jgi:site-specific DNA-methyltransferase (adenine-specific)
MRTLDDNSVDSIVTDPPYELGFMGKGWDKSGIANDPDMWAEALRVLKPGGHLLAFSGSRTYHRMVCAIEDAGFEVRDQIMWVYGSGFPKSHNGPWGGTALKPAHEPIVVARKPLDGTVAQTVARWGTGALNIAQCRVEASAKDVAAAAVPARDNLRFCQQDGKGRTDSVHDMSAGRWPANLIHDGSDEVLDLFAQFGEKTSNSTGRGKTRGLGYMGGAAGSFCEPRPTDTGTAARFFYCAKASKADRDAGLDDLPRIETIRYSAQGQGPKPQQTPRKPVEQRNTHPTVKPTALMAYLCRLVTPPGGTVLDPFMGSGSTGRGAALGGFSFIGIDLSKEYVDIARKRIADARKPARTIPFRKAA